MLKTYLDETGREIKLLEESFIDNDRVRISFWAHKIKASFQMLGLLQLNLVATELEKKAKNPEIPIESMRNDFDYIAEYAAISFLQAQRLVEDL
jgi:HPt (histidine-containing phosphotransfer) domain-containing protein